MNEIYKDTTDFLDELDDYEFPQAIDDIAADTFKSAAYYATHPEALEIEIKDESSKTQDTVKYLINKYGPNFTLEEVLKRYEEEKGENLDKTRYSGCGKKYDYEKKPIKITDIQYYLWLTEDEVKEKIEEMRSTASSAMVFVPYYDEDGCIEETYYLGLINTRYLTRHILDSDYVYDTTKWRYENGLFQFAIWFTDMPKLAGYYHKRLNIEEPDYIGEDISRRGDIVDEVCKKITDWRLRDEPAAKMMKEHMDGMRAKYQSK